MLKVRRQLLHCNRSWSISYEIENVNAKSLYIQQQMRVMQDEHHRAVEMLQRQLDHSEGELFRLQRNLQKSPPNAENEGVTEYIKDPRQTERPGAEVS